MEREKRALVLRKPATGRAGRGRAFSSNSGLVVFYQRVTFLRFTQNEGNAPVQVAHDQALTNLELHVFLLAELGRTGMVVGQPVFSPETGQCPSCSTNQLIGNVFLFKREREVDFVVSRVNGLHSFDVARGDIESFPKPLQSNVQLLELFLSLQGC